MMLNDNKFHVIFHRAEVAVADIWAISGQYEELIGITNNLRSWAVVTTLFLFSPIRRQINGVATFLHKMACQFFVRTSEL